MAQPAIRQEGDVEKDGRYGAAGYEERFELACTDVADVGYCLGVVHGWVVDEVPIVAPVDEKT